MTLNVDTSTRHRLAVLAIVLLALVLRLSLLDSKSLWLDETVRLQQAQESGKAIVAQRWDPPPPASHLFLHTWIDLGQSEWVLRFPSALFGGLSILILYWLAQTAQSSRLSLWAAGLLAVDPIHIWYSQEVRMYAIVTFLGLAGVYFTLQLLRRSGWIDWLGYILAFALASYFDYGGLALWILVLMAATFVMSWRRDWTRAKLVMWWSAQIATALLYVPWWPKAFDAFAFLTEGHIVRLIAEGAARLGLPLETQDVSRLIILLGAVTIGVALSIAIRYLRQRTPRLTTTPGLHRLLWPILVGYGVWLLLAAVPRLYSVKRQLVVIAPYVVLAAAAALISIRRHGYAYGLVVAAVGIAGLNLVVWPKEDWRSAASLVAHESRPGDAIAFQPAYASIPFDYYYDTSAGKARALDSKSGPEGAGGRVWLVIREADQANGSETSLKEITQSKTVVGQWDFYQVKVSLLQ